MRIIENTVIPEVKIIEPDYFTDHRGTIYTSFNNNWLSQISSTTLSFVEDVDCHSLKGSLRGLHYQIQKPQGKLIGVSQGIIFDVAVDMRRNSKTFGQWTGILLSSENQRKIYIPEGFAHGIYVLSDFADFTYKCTNEYSVQDERTIKWDDKDLAIEWPLVDKYPLLSKKDKNALSFNQAEYFS